MINAVDADKALAIYRPVQRSRRLHAVFVGNIDPATLQPLVELSRQPASEGTQGALEGHRHQVPDDEGRVAIWPAPAEEPRVDHDECA
jgi:hypothetical protein